MQGSVKKNWISIVNQDLCQAVVTEQRVFLSTVLQGVELEGGKMQPSSVQLCSDAHCQCWPVCSELVQWLLKYSRDSWKLDYELHKVME